MAIRETIDPLFEDEVQRLKSVDLLNVHEQALVTSMNIDVTHTPLEAPANENVGMLRQEILRRMAAFEV